jgi:hypothetical protein
VVQGRESRLDPRTAGAGWPDVGDGAGADLAAVPITPPSGLIWISPLGGIPSREGYPCICAAGRCAVWTPDHRPERATVRVGEPGKEPGEEGPSASRPHVVHVGLRGAGAGVC